MLKIKYPNLIRHVNKNAWSKQHNEGTSEPNVAQLVGFLVVKFDQLNLSSRLDMCARIFKDVTVLFFNDMMCLSIVEHLW